MKYKFKNKYIVAAALMLVATVGCKKDFDNPNAASTPEVFSSPKGMMGALVGAQRIMSMTIVPQMISSNALTTGEAIVVNVGNLSEANLVAGGASVDGNNGILGSLWISNCKVIFEADNVLRSAPTVGDANYRSGLIAYASILKANALGNLSMYWEQVPDTVGAPVTSPTRFIPRAQGFTKAIAILDNAIAAVTANAPNASFNNDLPAGLNLVNTLQALKARYSLYTGNFSAALAAANTVSTTVTSTWNFDALNPNQVFINVTASGNVYQPVDSTLGLPASIAPALTDARVSFYTQLIPTATPRYRMRGFFTATTTAIPVYLVDEMRLIRAECLVRQSSPDLTGAKALIDQVLQQVGTADANGVGANIAAGYTGTVDAPSLLTEIYRNRCIELFMSGLKLEDMRRFGRPTSERRRNFFPYPFRERDNNPNTPADPAF
ncbi:MAG: RagB/SusD family protein [Chitinophagaceae bacterium]